MMLSPTVRNSENNKKEYITMKPFEVPVIHIELFQIEDVITTSVVNEDTGAGCDNETPVF